MKKRISLLSLCLLAMSFSCKESKKADASENKTAETLAAFVPEPQPIPEQEVVTLALGTQAPDFNLPGVDGKFYSLKDFENAKVLVLAFTCNHCPTAQAYEDRIMDFVSDYAEESVQLVAISPNSPLGLLYEELGYSDLGDSYEDMIQRAADRNFNFPYLYDGDTQEVSLAYGPVATPHMFVFDQDRILRYVGRMDGSEKPGTANAEDLRTAVDQLLSDQEVETPETKTFGCSTKWGWKTALRDKIDREWAEKPVTLENLDVSGIKALLENQGEKLRLVNIWATWCGPCRLEYPDFIVVQRMFGARDFEFVSLSADRPERKQQALEFLKKSQSALPNYIVEAPTTEAMINAVDPQWDGALPYTVLIEPGGEIIYRIQGEADFPQLKKLIVEHPMIGRVY